MWRIGSCFKPGDFEQVMLVQGTARHMGPTGWERAGGWGLRYIVILIVVFGPSAVI